MKKILVLIGCMVAFQSYSDDVPLDNGVIIQEDVCGMGNAIIESESGLFIPIHYDSGEMFYEGDDVSGYFYFNEYADIYDQYENYGHYLIEDYQETEQDSVDILCD